LMRHPSHTPICYEPGVLLYPSILYNTELALGYGYSCKALRKGLIGSINIALLLKDASVLKRTGKVSLHVEISCKDYLVFFTYVLYLCDTIFGVWLSMPNHK